VKLRANGKTTKEKTKSEMLFLFKKSLDEMLFLFKKSLDEMLFFILTI